MFNTNYFQRYHQEQGDHFLQGFDRHLIYSTTNKKHFGISIDTTHFLFGHKIHRFEFFGYLIEIWQIPKKNNDVFQPINPKAIRKPIKIEMYEQKEPTFKNKLILSLIKIPYLTFQFLLPKNSQYSKIYEMYGQHDIESSLILTPKKLFFIRSKYLIKLAMDLKLLQDREIAQQKQADLNRKTNSFDLFLADNHSLQNQLPELNEFQLIKHYDDKNTPLEHKTDLGQIEQK